MDASDLRVSGAEAQDRVLQLGQNQIIAVFHHPTNADKPFPAHSG